MNNKRIKFIDLFAGIGGFRLGFERNNYECVFSSEIDPHACAMYELNFGENPKCDITTLNPNILPDFDVLCAGFPCQSFSICGRQKGFYDETRGTLFFDICRILEAKKPTAFVLENVSNLATHDNGRTLNVMLNSLESLGYTVSHRVLNAKDFGVPQNRERIIIVGNKLGKFFDFDKLQTNTISSMHDFLDKNGDFEFLDSKDYTLLDGDQIKIQPKSGLIFCGYRNKRMRTIGVRPGTQHLSRVHKQPNRIYSINGTHPTLASQESCGRYFIKTDDGVRKLTMNECFRFMGFPEQYKKIGTDAQLYARIGNSVCVNMVSAIAKEMKEQLFIGGNNMDKTVEFLENIYKEATQLKDLSKLSLSKEQINNVKIVVEKEETFKGVFTVLFTSLAYKHLHPEQDVRRHQANMENGYSGRSFDTKYITPFMKRKRFLGAMKESGWLTRSLEQNVPYDFNFPGKIQSTTLKNAFLTILNDISEKGASAYDYLLALIYFSVEAKGKKSVILVNPIKKETNMTIDEIMSSLVKHFYFKYKSRGASILPVIALYSVYECVINELKRFEDMYLEPLASHNSSDRSSGATGDIVVRRKEDDSIYEVVEVKFEIPINPIMIDDVYKKICDKNIQRYYILSTIPPTPEDGVQMNEMVCKIRDEHGCQVIINGLIPTIKYYLRLVENTDIFVENYIKNLNNDSEINYEHKIAWNTVISEKENNQ